MSNLKIKAVLILVAVVIAGGFVWQFKKTEKARADMESAIAGGNSEELDKILTENPMLAQMDYGRVEVTPFDTLARKVEDEAKSVEIAEILLKHKMDVNCKNILGITPLHSAVMFGRVNLAEFLINNKADINAKTGEGKTPLDIAKEHGDEDMLKLFNA